MYISDVLGTNKKLPSEQLFTIRYNCSEFLSESNGHPVYKQLPSHNSNYARVKVRHKFNPIAEQYFTSLVMPWESKTFVESYSKPSNQHDEYWIFPTNGYQYLYNPLIKDYKTRFKTVLEMTSDQELILEVAGSCYRKNNLNEAMEVDTEILWYNISHFYAVDCSLFQDYNELLQIL